MSSNNTASAPRRKVVLVKSATPSPKQEKQPQNTSNETLRTWLDLIKAMDVVRDKCKQNASDDNKNEYMNAIARGMQHDIQNMEYGEYAQFYAKLSKPDQALCLQSLVDYSNHTTFVRKVLTGESV